MQESNVLSELGGREWTFEGETVGQEEVEDFGELSGSFSVLLMERKESLGVS